jgi:tRNA threonylcarbamoyladenosine biosynthesis protein TsaB
MIQQVLAQADLAFTDLAGIGVGVGPAPYTGLRIGLISAKSLGLAAGVPVWGISELEVLAYQAASSLGLASGTVLSTLDAKRREVYWAIFKLNSVLANQPSPLANPGGDHGIGLIKLVGPQVSLPTQVPEADIVVGEGASLYPDQLRLSPGAPTQVDPARLAHLAFQRAAAGLEVGTQPLYLRRPHVQMAAPSQKVMP